MFGRFGQARGFHKLPVQKQAKLKVVGQQEVVQVQPETLVLLFSVAFQLRQRRIERFRFHIPDHSCPVRHLIIGTPERNFLRFAGKLRRFAEQVFRVPQKRAQKVPVRQFFRAVGQSGLFANGGQIGKGKRFERGHAGFLRRV